MNRLVKLILRMALVLAARSVAAQELTLVTNFALSYGSTFSIPVYDGSNVVISGETSDGNISLAKFDLELNQLSSPVVVAGTNDTAANDRIADHKHIFQNGYHYLTFSISGANYLYLLKLDRDLSRLAITTVASNDPPTNDMLMAGDGTNVCVGKFLPGFGHRIYKYDADLNLLLTNAIGGPPNNIHANGAALTYYNGSYYLVAPDTLAPGQNYRYSRLIFDSDWQLTSNKTTILSNSIPALSIVSGLSREPVSGSFIIHYGYMTNDQGGPIYMAVYDSNWTLLTNKSVIAGQWNRPHSVIVSNKLFLGYDGPNQAALFSISNAPAPIPVIQANHTDSSLSIPAGDTLTITAGLAAGAYAGANADWWLAAASQDGAWYYFDYLNAPAQWRAGLAVTWQGPIFDLSSADVLTISTLAPGVYWFYFGVDTVMDGLVTLDN
ncbi:MAG: hypothetical protein HYV35_09645, partial [Lentisphaerae bacterium]|nr:hypothetical protein [Lentisphaerota bacterium]